MNSRNWPGHWHPSHPPHPNPNLNHYPNPTTVSGQNPGVSQYNYNYGPYGYPTWGYYPQPPYWPPPRTQHLEAIQTSSVTPMMPPNEQAYQNNFQEEPYQEMWESPQSPQSPWIRAFERHESEEN